MTFRTLIVVLVLGLGPSLTALAADAPTAQHGSPKVVTGPAAPQRADWPPTALAVLAPLFLPAIFVGPPSGLNLPEEPQVEDFHSHDEPPGASHHHGASGTVDHSAPDKPHHH